MSRLKGIAAAGLQLLNTKPASLSHYGRYASLFSGCVVLLMAYSSLIGVNGQVVPVPPRKPDTQTLAQIQPVVKSNPDLQIGPFRSIFGGQQMDLYRDIFRLQAAGSMDKADTLISELHDDSLMGHVLAQRYLHPDYKASFAELKGWMEKYSDLPEADRIERLANSRTPGDYKGDVVASSYEAADVEEVEAKSMAAKSYESKVKRSKAQDNDAAAMIKTIRHQVEIYEPSNAMRTLKESMASVYLDDVEKDRLKAIIASGYLYAGNLDAAEKLSAEALERSQAYAPMSGWVHGLTMWRKNDYSRAAASFALTANSPYATGNMIAAAAFWAARSYEKTGMDHRADNYLKIAAEYPRTFYGLLALQSLKETPDFNWNAPKLSSSEERAIVATPAGQRAERLIAAGEVTLAEAEIKSLYIKGDHRRKQSLLAYAYDRRLPSLTLKLAHAQVGPQDAVYDAALYPSMPWQPNKGYRIDRALMHAIIRQESRFNASAENKGSGAVGLMQLMPKTAGYMADSDIFNDGDTRHLLKNPEVSLDIGQKYVEYLLNNPLVGQDLLSLAIAYNAGPGTLAKWKSERADVTDPLMFIETLPFAETRNFVQRVMTNYWIYRMRFDQNDDSMQALANGNWARYASQDAGAAKFADAR